MENTMYNYYYDGQPISKLNFISAIPNNWENEINEQGEYSYGSYRAIPRD